MPVVVANALSLISSPDRRSELLGELFIQHVSHPELTGRALVKAAIRADRMPRAERAAVEMTGLIHAGQCRLAIC